jgi:hypothetical protein
MSLILLLSLLVVMTAAGMGVGVYFGLIRQTPAENAKDQSAAATAAQSVGGFENFGVPDAAVLSGPVPPLNFQVVLAVPAVSADQGCRTWFSSDEVSSSIDSINSSGSGMTIPPHIVAQGHKPQVLCTLWLSAAQLRQHPSRLLLLLPLPVHTVCMTLSTNSFGCTHRCSQTSCCSAVCLPLPVILHTALAAVQGHLFSFIHSSSQAASSAELHKRHHLRRNTYVHSE